MRRLRNVSYAPTVPDTTAWLPPSAQDSSTYRHNSGPRAEGEIRLSLRLRSRVEYSAKFALLKGPRAYVLQPVGGGRKGRGEGERERGGKSIFFFKNNVR